jgi:hypothetical protein
LFGGNCGVIMKKCAKCNANMDDDEEACASCGHTKVPPLDDALLGFWRIVAVQRPQVEFNLFYLEPGNVAEFSSDGFLIDWTDSSDPYAYYCRSFCEKDVAAMNFWGNGFYHLRFNAIYRCEGQYLEVCFSDGNNSPPTDFKLDNQQVWSVMRLQRSEPPKNLKASKWLRVKRMGRLIPAKSKGKLDQMTN